MTTQAHGNLRGVASMIGPGLLLSSGEALEKLFLDNADRGANTANDELVAALRQRARAIQARAHLTTPPPPRPDTTARN